MTRSSVLVLILVAGGCADRYTLADYRRDLATLHCARMRECCTPGEYHDWWTGEKSTQVCETEWERAPDSFEVDGAVDEGKLVFDPVAAHECLDALRVQACGDFEPAYRYHETYCASSLVGQVLDGQDCHADLECVTTHCGLGPDRRGRVCVPGVATGATCDSSRPCDRPDACQADGRCGRGLPAGERCDSDEECIDDWCQGYGLFNDGTCVSVCHGG